MLKFRSIGLCFLGIWVLLVALASEPAFAQKKQKKVRKNRSDIIEVADDYFHNQEYYEAIIHYKKAFEYNPKDAYVQYRMGDCYRHMFNYTEAEGFYSKCIEFGPTWETPHPEYWYGLMLKNNGKYAEAKVQFEQFTKSFKPKAKEDLKYYTQAKLELEACDFAIKETQTPPKDYHFQLLPPPVNTKYSEYAPSFYLNDSTIAITSTRHTGKEDHKFTTMFGDAYSRSYRFEKKDSWTEEKRDDNFFVINGDHNNGAGCFNKAKTKYYFTNCSTPDGTCGIYVSHLKEGKWHKPERLNDHINKPGTWNGQPSLNETDDTLYFVSKRPGGKGMHDIWVSNCTGRQEDSWIEPTNLGEHINTPFSELSPHHYHVEKTLFFSSNGKPGLGGLDIFVAHGDSFQTVVNLGVPFNSSKDDFYFNYGRHRGYLCSNRDGGIGSDDIYMFHIDKNLSVLAYLEVNEPVDSTKLAQNAAEQNSSTESQTGNDPTARVEDTQSAAPPTETNTTESTNPENNNTSNTFVAANTSPSSTSSSKNAKNATAATAKSPSKGAKNASNKNNTSTNSKSNTSSTNQANTSNQVIPPVVILAPIPTENKANSESTSSKSNAREGGSEENSSATNESSNASSNTSQGNTSTSAQRSDGQPVAVKVIKATPAKAPTNPAAKAKVTTPAKTTDGKTTKSISVSGQVVDETNQPVADAENMLTEENGTVLKKSKTNQKGEFKYSNIPADKNYTIVVKEKGTENASSVGSSTPKKYAVKSLNVNASDVNPSKNLFENIYFDFDKAELRPEAKKVLDELYTYWSQHTDVQIEMNAYTDDWGENEYNQLLAEKRGQMGIDYLVQKGMDRSAIVLAAQGETNPLAPNMSLIGRQLNRRVEFSIVGGPGFVTNTMTYVLEPKNTLYSIAKKYNMTVDELKELNGLTDESILAWRPLRVKKSDDASASIAPVTLEAMQRAYVATNGDSLQTATQSLDVSNPFSEVQLTQEEENIYQIYVVEPQNTMYSISRQFAMSVEELKSINGLTSNILKIGQRLKVKK